MRQWLGEGEMGRQLGMRALKILALREVLASVLLVLE